MAQEQDVNINFAEGLNTKTDPWQLPIGQFERLVNSVFQKGKRLQKRNGYGTLSGDSPESSAITTYNGNLIAVGETISARSESTQSWVTKGSLQPASLGVLPLIRNNLNQVQTDSAVANSLVCTVYTQKNSVTSPLQSTYTYLYCIENIDTGQSIVAPASLPTLSTGAISGSSRVFVVGNNFVVVSPVTVSSTTYLQYFSISTSNPGIVSSAQNTFAEAYVPTTSNPGWDGVVADGCLVLAYNSTAGGQGIHITVLTSAQIASNSASGVVHSFTNAAYIGSIISACVDATVNPSVIYVSFWNSSTTDAYTCAVYLGFGTITTKFTPQKILPTVAVTNLASAAQNSSCLVFGEITNAYSFDATVPSNLIRGVSVSSTGTVGTPYVAVRSVGLASKAFIVDGSIYFLSAFQSTFQPSYFLMNGSSTTSASPVVVAKLAYQNGGGYLSLGLPSVTVSDSSAWVSYLFKQNVEALNTLNNTQQTTAGGIYSQLGINLVRFDLGTDATNSAEIGSDLHLSGGFLGMFDGFEPVEHNFFIFPEPIKCTWLENSQVTPTGTVTSGSATVTSVSSVAGVYPGMTITGTSIPTGTTILLVGTNTILMSAAATGTHAAETITIQGNIASKPDGSTLTNAYYYQAVYEWTDMQGNAFRSAPSIPVSVTTTGAVTTGTITVNVPTLRLTAKITNAAKIVLYRWSAQSQAYNQVTSVTYPILNDTTTDSIAFVDTLPDASVIGNNLIYTTGGVVPDTNGPASDIMTLFDTRLCLVDAEDPNVLWVSKTVVEGTPVEMSSDFTIYVAPNIGTTSSSGPMRSIAPMDDKLIIFKKNSIFYINGTGPDNLGTTAPGCPLGSYSQPTFITSVVGCVNQKSIVLTHNGLMFQSDKGIWLLSRDLKTSYVGAPVEDYNSSVVTSTNVIPETNYVLFDLDTGEILMYDYYYDQWGVFEGVPAVSSCIYNDRHTVLNKYGHILQETPGKYMDGSNPVLMSFKTSWLNLASLQGYERFYEFYLLARYLSPHTLVAQVAYDYNDSVYHSSTIRPTNFSPSTPSAFGVPTPVGSGGSLEQWRIHAKKQLCQSFQLSVTEVYDPSLGEVPGAGFTMSGINCKVGIKKGRRPIAAAKTVG